jgi:hypothetical protein
MKYTKPAITLIGEAESAIQGVPKHGVSTDMSPTYITNAAYEADE